MSDNNDLDCGFIVEMMDDLLPEIEQAALNLFGDNNAIGNIIRKLKLSDLDDYHTGLLVQVFAGRIVRNEFVEHIEWHDACDLIDEAYNTVGAEATYQDFADCFRRLAEDFVSKKGDDE